MSKEEGNNKRKQLILWVLLGAVAFLAAGFFLIRAFFTEETTDPTTPSPYELETVETTEADPTGTREAPVTSAMPVTTPDPGTTEATLEFETPEAPTINTDEPTAEFETPTERRDQTPEQTDPPETTDGQTDPPETPEQTDPPETTERRTTEAPTTTKASETTQAPTTTSAPTTTAPRTTEAHTTTRAPESSETPTTAAPTTPAPQTTEAPTTTPAVTTTEAPTTTETPTTPPAPPTTPAPTTTVPPTTTAAPTTAEPYVYENRQYSDKDHVAAYIQAFGHLPSNYITKSQAENRSGWQKQGYYIGGDYFGNYEGILPKKSGRKYYECDISYTQNNINKGNRGTKRIVYSNDGLIFYTEDHYEHFQQYRNGSWTAYN